MREELRRNNTIGDIRGIRYFSDTVLKGADIKKESAQKICSFVNDIRINYNCSVAFYEYLDFIVVSPELVIAPTASGRKLHSVIGTDEFDRLLCETCILKITSDSIIDISAIRFDVTNSKYYILKHGFPVSAAIFRNVLIQFHALTEQIDGSLEISSQYESFFADVQKAARKKKSLETLKKQLEQQEIQGELAELFVLNFEKSRISSSSISQRIKRISIIDVSAGYDIVSFNDDLSSKYDRFIEVKSFIGSPHFYWSKNEIDMATLYEENYYLYLVDANKIESPDYSPMIIYNPAKKIINSDEWLMQPTSYLVIPTEKL